MSEQHMNIQKSVKILIILFASKYLSEQSYSKTKYAKNIYRNWHTDSYLDDI